MPELPEVTVVVLALNDLIINKTIKSIKINKPKMIKELSENDFRDSLLGKTISRIFNVGKFIVFDFGNNLYMLSHLRMEGKYFYYNKPTVAKKHVHIVFKFSDNSELHYMDTRIFGTFHIRQKDFLEVLPLSKLSTEPKNTNYKDLHKVLTNKKIAIKTALLDQTILVGLGNIYVDEVLFISQIHPQTPSNKITLHKTNKILINASNILSKAIKCGGSSTSSYASVNWKFGTYQKYLKVHTKKGAECTVCSTIIEKIKVNGRGTYFCPKCQINIYI